MAATARYRTMQVERRKTQWRITPKKAYMLLHSGALQSWEITERVTESLLVAALKGIVPKYFVKDRLKAFDVSGVCAHGVEWQSFVKELAFAIGVRIPPDSRSPTRGLVTALEGIARVSELFKKEGEWDGTADWATGMEPRATARTKEGKAGGAKSEEGSGVLAECRV